MIKHKIRKYRQGDDLVIESWLQINFLCKAICFSKKQIKLSKTDYYIALLNDR